MLCDSDAEYGTACQSSPSSFSDFSFDSKYTIAKELYILTYT